MVVLASCGSITPGSIRTVSPTPSVSPSPRPTTPSSPSPSTSPTPDTAGVARCVFADLVISDRSSGAAGGSSGTVLLFRNRATGPCVLGGYPGVAGLNASGQKVAQAVRTPTGYLGGLPPGQTVPPVVYLAAGATASALVEGSDNPLGPATSCPTLAGLLVTPPGSYHSELLPHWAPGDCSPWRFIRSSRARVEVWDRRMVGDSSPAYAAPFDRLTGTSRHWTRPRPAVGSC